MAIIERILPAQYFTPGLLGAQADQVRREDQDVLSNNLLATGALLLAPHDCDIPPPPPSLPLSLPPSLPLSLPPSPGSDARPTA